MKKYDDDLDDVPVVYPITAEIKLGGGIPEEMSFDCLEDLILYMKTYVISTVQTTDRDVVPRGGKPNFFNPSMFLRGGVSVAFEYQDDKSSCLEAQLTFHMPVPLSQALH